MAKNYIMSGHTLPLTLVDGAASGQLVEVESIIAVATVNIPAGGSGACAISGVWELPKTAGEAIVQGKKVYLGTDNTLTTTAGADKPFAGYAVQNAASADSSVAVLLNALPAARV